MILFGMIGMAFAQENLLTVPVILDSETEITLEPSVFEKINAGFYLTIRYKNSKADNHSLKLLAGEKNPLAYGAVKGAESVKNTIYPDKSSGSFSYIVIPRDVAALKRNGLTVKGQGLKITKITCEPAPVVKKKGEKIKAEVPKIKFEANPAPKFTEGTSAESMAAYIMMQAWKIKNR